MGKELFRADQRKLIAELMKIVVNFKSRASFEPYSKSSGKRNEAIKGLYKPGFGEQLGPTALYRNFWSYYLTGLFEHGKPSKKDGGKTLCTKLKRRTEIKRLKTVLGYNPSSIDLIVAFELPTKFDEICRVIDRDIKKLTQKKNKFDAGRLQQLAF